MSIIRPLSLEIKKGHACGGELVVSADGVLLDVLREVDGLREGDGGEGLEDLWGADGVAGYVVEGCVCALELWGGGGVCSGAGVVLGAAADGDVAEGEAWGDRGKGRGC